jgi:hypothetical protein
MDLALSTFGISFAAFCVWLTVRIANRGERWAKWTLAAVLILAYPVSFGPACWISSPVRITLLPGDPPNLKPVFSTAPKCYWPIGWLAVNGPDAITACIVWYATRRCDGVILQTTAAGDFEYMSLSADE